MSEVRVAKSAALAVASPPKRTGKDVKSPVVKKPKAKASHPPTGEMVIVAVKTLKERGGSSLQAIKKYLAANYKVDCEKLAPFIKKFLKSAVASGQLLQTKGKGASGSFKLPAVAKRVDAQKPAAKKSATKKPATKNASFAKSAKKALSSTKIKKPVAKKLTEKKVALARLQQRMLLYKRLHPKKLFLLRYQEQQRSKLFLA